MIPSVRKWGWSKFLACCLDVVWMCVCGAADSRRIALDLLQIAKHRFYTVLGIRIRMFLGLPDPAPLVRGTDPDPDPDPSLFFFNPGSRVITILHPRSASESKNFSIFNPNKTVSKNWSGMLILDPRSGSAFCPYPGSGSRLQGSKKHRIPDLQYWLT